MLTRAARSRSLARGSAASLLMALVCLVMPACKPAADAKKTVEQPPKETKGSSVQGRAEDTLVQQAANSCRQRIQNAATEHAMNATRLQEAKVLVMTGEMQRGQLEAKREAVRKFLSSNEALKLLLVNEERDFQEELAKLDVPQVRIESELRSFQSCVPSKTVTLRMRAADERIGIALLGALDFLDEIWGQWKYNNQLAQFQFSPSGALQKYNGFLEAIEAASKEQRELQGQ